MYQFLLKTGKGIYGIGQTQISPDDLEINFQSAKSILEESPVKVLDGNISISAVEDFKSISINTELGGISLNAEEFNSESEERFNFLYSNNNSAYRYQTLGGDELRVLDDNDIPNKKYVDERTATALLTDEKTQEIVKSVAELGVLEGIDNQAKKALESLKGYQTYNFFNKNNLQDGFIANETDDIIRPSTSGQKVSGKIYLSKGEYSYYGVGAEYTFGFFHYTQIFDLKGRYLSTFRSFGTVNNFEMPEDGYVIIDYNNKVAGDPSAIFLGVFNSLFSVEVNTRIFYKNEINNGYNPKLVDLPELVFKATDNILDVTKLQAPTSTTDNVDYVLRYDIPKNEDGTLIHEYISIRDNFQLFNREKKFLIEYSTEGEETGSFIPNQLGQVFKRHKLNPLSSSIEVRFFDPNFNANWGGEDLDPIKINDNLRINFGGYFTRETKGQKLVEANGFDVEEIVNPLKGKKIAAFGDSITSGVHPISRSYLDELRESREVDLQNYASGSAGFTDWDDTVDTGDNYTIDGQSHNNVVSNQISKMISDGFIPDYVILTGLTNDAFRNRSIGEIEIAKANYNNPELQNRQEVFGMAFYAIKKLRQINPAVRILLISPINSVEVDVFSNHNTLLKPLKEAFELIPSVLGVDFLQFGGLLNNLDTNLPSIDYQDALHPSLNGVKKMEKRVLGKLLEFFS